MEMLVKSEDVLVRLEQHEAECNLRYKRIEERLDEQRDTLKGLDLRIWGIGALIIGLAVAESFV